MSSEVFSKSLEAANAIRQRLQPALLPKIAVVLGSGLGAFAGQIEAAVAIPYTQIPHFPKPTVEGHSGMLVIGMLGSVPLAVMQGRVHGYEGFSATEVTFPVRVLRQLGVETLVLTNAAGGIRERLTQGDLVLISDHINLTGSNPLIGPNEPRFGERFFDMTEAYSLRLRELAQLAASKNGFELNEAVYLAVTGPSFETPAEIRAFQALGAGLVGMSTVHETIVARHMGMEVLGISCVTNLAAGIQGEPLDHHEVLATGREVQAKFAGLLTTLIASL